MPRRCVDPRASSRQPSEPTLPLPTRRHCLRLSHHLCMRSLVVLSRQVQTPFATAYVARSTSSTPERLPARCSPTVRRVATRVCASRAVPKQTALASQTLALKISKKKTNCWLLFLDSSLNSHMKNESERKRKICHVEQREKFYG